MSLKTVVVWDFMFFCEQVAACAQSPPGCRRWHLVHCNSCQHAAAVMLQPHQRRTPAVLAAVPQGLPFPSNTRGALETDSTLQVHANPRVFALGDVAGAMGSADPAAAASGYPATAQVAFQQADYAAWNIWAAMNGRPLLPFRWGGALFPCHPPCVLSDHPILLLSGFDVGLLLLHTCPRLPPALTNLY
jgi:hypothetical protein